MTSSNWLRPADDRPPRPARESRHVPGGRRGDTVRMTLPALVLVHGGEHAADCWDLTVAELGRQEPALRVLAVDLPGYGDEPGELATATVADWVDCVVSRIDAEGLDEVVVVGHSLAGLTVPGGVTKLGSKRVP